MAAEVAVFTVVAAEVFVLRGGAAVAAGIVAVPPRRLERGPVTHVQRQARPCDLVALPMRGQAEMPTAPIQTQELETSEQEIPPPLVLP